MNSAETTLPILENVPLAPYTTLGIGGPARFLLHAKTEGQLLGATEFARQRGCPVFVLGSGSNVLISDAGFSGLVIKVELKGIENRDGEENGNLSVAAGVDWDLFVQHCVDRDLAGIECLSGIPGTVGGAPVQSIGAYGQDIGEVVREIRALDLGTNRLVQLSGGDCRFAYRSSIFNSTHKDRYIILRVDFALRTDRQPRLLYTDLQRKFALSTHPATIREVREAVLDIRRSKSMILNAEDPDAKSAGSFFKNPVLDTGFVSAMEDEARARGLLRPSESIPRFAAGAGKEKLPAAWLIERSGFHKGYRHGNAGISGKHTLALINAAGATAQEILELMHMIQDGVRETFGVALQPEPVFVGFEK